MCLLSQLVDVGMTTSQASFALEPSSSSTVMLGKCPHEASTDGGSNPRLRAMLRRSVRYMSFAFSIRLLSALSYMGLNLACIVQRFLHDGAVLGHGASTQCCRRVIPSLHDSTIPGCGTEDVGPDPVAVRASCL